MIIDPVTGECVAVFVRTPYNYDMNRVSRETGLCCVEPTKAQQQFKEECDINTLVKRFGLTGEMPQDARMPLSPEFVETMDYQSALNALMDAEDEFMKYPSDLRARFENDPGKFIAFLEDSKNLDELRKMGLARPEKAVPEPISVKVIPDPSDGVKTPTKSA
jgi:phage internal scaffolding protein